LSDFYPRNASPAPWQGEESQIPFATAAPEYIEKITTNPKGQNYVASGTWHLVGRGSIDGDGGGIATVVDSPSASLWLPEQRPVAESLNDGVAHSTDVALPTMR
jgi:hypothetical protein